MENANDVQKTAKCVLTIFLFAHSAQQSLVSVFILGNANSVSLWVWVSRVTTNANLALSRNVSNAAMIMQFVTSARIGSHSLTMSAFHVRMTNV